MKLLRQIPLISMLLIQVAWLGAAEIFWEEPQDITGRLTDFDQLGDPVYRWNGGGGTVTLGSGEQAMTFVAGPSLSSEVGNMDPYDRGEDQNYEVLLSTMTWNSSATSLQLTNLEVGHRYRLQLWLADTRSCCTGRSKTYASGPGTNPVTLRSGPPGQFVIGSFIADAATQELSFIGGGAEHPQYNAIVLRDLGPPTPIIESFTVQINGQSFEQGVRLAEAGTVTFNWSVGPADELELVGYGSLESNGTITLQVDSTQAFELRATNAFGVTSQSIRVQVGGDVLPPQFSEILASNDEGLVDEDGDAEDWIEIFNPNPFAIDLGGIGLSDIPGATTPWRFPEGTWLQADAYLVVFASGKNRISGELHTDFRLASDGDYLAMIASDSPETLDLWPPDYPANAVFPEQYEDQSYGLNEVGEFRYFPNPTPGAANSGGVLGFVADTRFDVDRGFFDAPFDLTISTATEGARIYYTSDGTHPTESEDQLYTGPIRIDSTQVIRAMAVKDGLEPTDIDTQTYVFATDLVRSADMDPAIYQSAEYGAQMEDALRALPIISLSVDEFEQVDNSVEKVTSVEWIKADGSKGFQVDAGIALFGGYFTNFAKKSFRLKFRKLYGPGKLNFPLFEGFERDSSPVDEFDALDLRSGSHDMVLRGAYLSNRFTDDSLLEMGNLAPHGRYVHVMINGRYWGQYHLRERWNAKMAADYLGGDPDTYEAINGNKNVGGWAPGVVYDGDGRGWADILSRATGSSPWAELQERVDFQSYLDFMILYEVGRSENEYRTVLQPFTGGTKAQFYLNDADGFFNTQPAGQNNDAGGPGNLLGELLAEIDPEFRIYLADQIHRRLFADGVLSLDEMRQRLRRRVDETKLSFLCESARWGYRTPASFLAFQQNLIDSQMAQQRDGALAQFRRDGWYPSVEAPVLSRNGGIVEPGFGVAISSPSGGTVYYTRDGSDPRLPGGAIREGAQSINGVADQSSQLIRAGGKWRYWDAGVFPGATWNQPEFDDDDWSSGNAQLGYGDGDEITELDFGNDPDNKPIVSYFRKAFEIDDPTTVVGLTLELLRDDGAVVYLNGEEVVRSNLPDGILSNQTRALSAIGGANEQAISQFSIDPNELRVGTNVIAVAIHQVLPTSSDISFDLALVAELDATRQPDIILTESETLSARALVNGTWSAMNRQSFLVTQQPVLPNPGDLVISELNYHPLDPSASELAVNSSWDEDDFEFFELMNVSTKPLLLDGCRMVDGVSFVFPTDSVLGVGDRCVVVKNADAFKLRYPSFREDGVYSAYSGKLSNSGETLTLVDAAERLLLEISYRDGTDRENADDAFWPDSADGGGDSLVLIDPKHRGGTDALSWRGSLGSPNPQASDALRMPSDLDGDRDGQSEKLEALLAGDDRNPTRMGKVQMRYLTNEPSVAGSATLEVSFLRDTRYPLSAVLESAPDLGADSWQEAGELLRRERLGNGLERLTYQITVEGDGAEFVRVRLVE